MKSTMIKLIPVVAAVAALSFSAGAFAGGNNDDHGGYGNQGDDHGDQPGLTISKHISYKESADIKVKGDLHVTSKALAVNDNDQSRKDLKTENFRSKNDVIVDGNAFKGAEGLVSVNVAGGSANQQNNGLALAVTRSHDGKALLDAENFNKQTAKNVTTDDGFTNNNAKIEGQAFESFKGIATVNVAGGEGNQQNNGVAIAGGKGIATTATNTSKQSLDKVKITNNDDLEDSYCPYQTPFNNNFGNGAVSEDYGHIGNDAFAYSKGVMAVNVASGISNQQNNGIAATVNMSH